MEILRTDQRLTAVQSCSSLTKTGLILKTGLVTMIPVGPSFSWDNIALEEWGLQPPKPSLGLCNF